MANFEIIWADDFQKQLENLGAKFDEIAPKMIDEAAPILEESMKRKLLRHKDTGELINSIKAKKAKPVKGGGYYGYVTATGVAKGKVYKRARKKRRIFYGRLPQLSENACFGIWNLKTTTNSVFTVCCKRCRIGSTK